ncbi:MAG: N-acyl homoserine lactonase family protein [Halobellus sp.]|uniref:N-acyl homoserine lactonase family protein n=1 Tax=Halobellus sp. TaxID=1979212 RepID=UPI0035D4AD20
MAPRVTPKCCGSLTMDADVLIAGASGTVEAPSTVYLIEADETILVDTGFGDPAEMTDKHPDFECSRTREQALETVLDSEGYVPSDIDSIVFTHLDWDHCYNLSPFDAETTFYVQRRELEYAIDPYPIHAVRYEATSLERTPPWLGRDLKAIEGETRLCEGVVAFPTPGHTVGHQSVAVRTARGTTVIAADAIPTFENVDRDEWAPVRRGLAMNDIEWWESACDVLARGETILPGHEWEILDAEPGGRAG